VSTQKSRSSSKRHGGRVARGRSLMPGIAACLKAKTQKWYAGQKHHKTTNDFAASP